MARIAAASGCLLLILVVGCSPDGQPVDELSDEVARLEVENEVLEIELERAIEEIDTQAQELEDARRIADIAEAQDCPLGVEQRERLIQCEQLLFGVTKYPEADVEAPGILFIPTHGYRTIEPQITVEVMAAEGSTVTIDGAEASELMAYAGGLMRYAREVDLEIGSNAISVSVTSISGEITDLPMVVYHDPQLVQRFGFVVATPIEDYGSTWQVGVDFVDVDMGGEFGNTYDNPQVDIELFPVSAGALASIRDGATGFGIYSEELLVLTGREIRDMFHGFHGHPERLDGDPHTWVFSLLIDNGRIVQFEPIPIGS